MSSEIYKEARKIWVRFTKDACDKDSTSSLSIHKKLLSLFHVGDFYYYIFHVKSGVFEYMSEDITLVLGYDRDEVDVPFLLSRIHPEDQPYFLHFENKVTAFFSALRPDQPPVLLSALLSACC